MTKYEAAERMQQKWEGGGQRRGEGGPGGGGALDAWSPFDAIMVFL